MRARRSPLHIQVDRRWDFDRRPPVAAFFIVLGNSSDEVVEVKDVKLDSVGMEEEHFLLQPDEERELKAPIKHDGPRPGQIPKVTVTLADGRQVSSSDTPDVPLRTPVLERFAP